jgi:hypothetical protein
LTSPDPEPKRSPNLWILFHPDVKNALYSFVYAYYGQEENWVYASPLQSPHIFIVIFFMITPL